MSQGGKMSLPVDPASLIYSHFEHVSGIAAPKGSQGVSINKLNLLDVLIGQINQIKKEASPLFSDKTSPAEYLAGKQKDSRHLDALIEAFKKQITDAKAASTAMPYLQSPTAPSGAVFSIII